MGYYFFCSRALLRKFDTAEEAIAFAEKQTQRFGVRYVIGEAVHETGIRPDRSAMNQDELYELQRQAYEARKAEGF